MYKLCNPKVCRIFVGGFFIKKTLLRFTFDNPHNIYYIWCMGDIILIVGIIVVIVGGMIWFTNKVDDL